MGHSYGIWPHPVFTSRTTSYTSATRHRETPYHQGRGPHQGKGPLGPLDDDDDIEWKHNPFDADHVNESGETPEELLAKITFEGSEYLQTNLKALVMEFIDGFATKVRRAPADVEPMKISVDEEKWRLPCNRAPPRRHSEEKQKEIRKQVDASTSHVSLFPLLKFHLQHMFCLSQNIYWLTPVHIYSHLIRIA